MAGGIDDDRARALASTVVDEPAEMDRIDAFDRNGGKRKFFVGPLP